MEKAAACGMREIRGQKAKTLPQREKGEVLYD